MIVHQVLGKFTLALHPGWRSNKFSVVGHRNNVVRARTLRHPVLGDHPRSSKDPPAPAADKIFKNENEWFSVEKHAGTMLLGVFEVP